MTTNNPSRRERILGGLWGSLVGDALGVPVEFLSREDVRLNPITGMRGNGTHLQPPGTWSDDGALVLCTVESLLSAEFDTNDMGRRFVSWMKEARWTATGVVFDMGNTTADALMRIANGIPAEQAGNSDEFSNGNGSLMRIIPAVLRFAAGPIETLVSRIERISGITHSHARSKMACVFYGLVVRQLLTGCNPETALLSARKDFRTIYNDPSEISHFSHCLTDDFSSISEDHIMSTGYVLHTLHASLWCLLSTNSFEECVLKAVNLGGDTDTTGCVTGGLAGVWYGIQKIPEHWRSSLARHGDVDCLFLEFADFFDSNK